jgi:pyruvoyl-dependent arginine decarboxylase (PvlArgDC)
VSGYTTVYTTISSDCPGDVIACGLVVVVPEDPDVTGVIFETHMFGDRHEVSRTLDCMAEDAAGLRGIEQFRAVKAVSELRVTGGTGCVVAAALMIPRSMQKRIAAPAG